MKVKKKTIFEVDYNDVDEAINKFLKEKNINVESECVCDNEWNNDTIKSYQIEKFTKGQKEFFEKYDKPNILKGKMDGQTWPILQWMCDEGIIEEGEYFIDISW